MGSRSRRACWVLPLTSGFLGLHRAQDKAGRGEGRLVCPLQGRRARDSEVLAVKEEVGGRSVREEWAGSDPSPSGKVGARMQPPPHSWREREVHPSWAGGNAGLGGGRPLGSREGVRVSAAPLRICRSNKLHSFWTVVCITGRKVKPQNECVLLVFLSHRTSASSKDSPVCTSGRLLCPLSSSDRKSVV